MTHTAATKRNPAISPVTTYDYGTVDVSSYPRGSYPPQGGCRSGQDGSESWFQGRILKRITSRDGF